MPEPKDISQIGNPPWADIYGLLNRLHCLFQEAENHGLEVGMEAVGYGSFEEVYEDLEAAREAIREMVLGPQPEGED